MRMFLFLLACTVLAACSKDPASKPAPAVDVPSEVTPVAAPDDATAVNAPDDVTPA